MNYYLAINLILCNNASLCCRSAMATGQVDLTDYGKILLSGFGPGPDRKSRKDMDKRSDDIYNKRRSDMTPLHTATMKDRNDVALRLLESFAPVNIVW